MEVGQMPEWGMEGARPRFPAGEDAPRPRFLSAAGALRAPAAEKNPAREGGMRASPGLPHAQTCMEEYTVIFTFIIIIYITTGSSLEIGEGIISCWASIHQLITFCRIHESTCRRYPLVHLVHLPECEKVRFETLRNP